MLSLEILAYLSASTNGTFEGIFAILENQHLPIYIHTSHWKIGRYLKQSLGYKRNNNNYLSFWDSALFCDSALFYDSHVIMISSYRLGLGSGHGLGIPSLVLSQNCTLSQNSVHCTLYITPGVANLWPAGHMWPFSKK